MSMSLQLLIACEEFPGRETSYAAPQRPACTKGSIHGANVECSSCRTFFRDNAQGSQQFSVPSWPRQTEDRNRRMDRIHQKIRALPPIAYSLPATALLCHTRY